MKNHCFNFENLEVYKSARLLVKQIYIIQRKFPREEVFALGDQIRRSSSSVTANIAEGSGRTSLKEKLHFIEISYGSLMEAFCQIQTAQDLDYITDDDVDILHPHFVEVAKMLSGLRTFFLKQIENNAEASITHNL